MLVVLALLLLTVKGALGVDEDLLLGVHIISPTRSLLTTCTEWILVLGSLSCGLASSVIEYFLALSWSFGLPIILLLSGLPPGVAGWSRMFGLAFNPRIRTPAPTFLAFVCLCYL